MQFVMEFHEARRNEYADLDQQLALGRSDATLIPPVHSQLLSRSLTSDRRPPATSVDEFGSRVPSVHYSIAKQFVQVLTKMSDELKIVGNDGD